MKLIRMQRPAMRNWSPFDQLINLREEINRLFDLPSGDLGRQTEFFNGWTPAVDLYEDKDHLYVRAELPGLKKEAIDVSVHDGVLSISGERGLEEPKEEQESYRSERFVGRFHRTVTLPKPVNVDQVKASYKDGVLTVTLPKTEEAKPKQIEVKVS
jgi:HSP20 family protein